MLKDKIGELSREKEDILGKLEEVEGRYGRETGELEGVVRGIRVLEGQKGRLEGRNMELEK